MLMSCTTVLVRLQPSGKGVTVPNRHPEGSKAGWAPMWIGPGIRLDRMGLAWGLGGGLLELGALGQASFSTTMCLFLSLAMCLVISCPPSQRGRPENEP